MPKRLKIGHRVIDVIIDQSSHGGLGLAQTVQGKIRVTASTDVGTIIPEIEQADTLIHEILHIMWEQKDILCDEDIEEKAVTLIAHGLIELFARNPAILNYLKEVCKEK